MKLSIIENKLRKKLKKAIKNQDYETIYQIESNITKYFLGFFDDLIANLPNDYVSWAEIRKANEILTTMTLLDILNNLKEVYWVNQQSPKVLFILKGGNKIRTPLSKEEEKIPISRVEQVSIKCISKQDEKTYEFMS